jgi:hypothetical protein
VANFNKAQFKLVAKDLMSNFLYYNRKEDDEFPVGSVERAIISRKISIDEILGVFKKEIEESVKGYEDE